MWSGWSRSKVVSEGCGVGGWIVRKAVEGNRPASGIGFRAVWEEVLAWAGWHAWSWNTLRGVKVGWESWGCVRVVVHWDPNIDFLVSSVTTSIGNGGSQVEDTAVRL